MSKARDKRPFLRGIALFFVFFTIFFILGYVQGRRAIRSEAFLYKTVLSRIVVFNKNPSYFLQTNQPLYQIYFPSQSKPKFTFDLSSNQLRETLSTRMAGSSHHSTFTPMYLENSGELISGLLGAGTAWTVKDAIEYLAAREGKLSWRLKRVCTAVIGALSGYTAGYWMATHYEMDPYHSSAIEEFLSKKEHWVKVKRLLWIELFYRTCYLPQRIENADELTNRLGILPLPPVRSPDRSNSSVVSFDFKSDHKYVLEHNLRQSAYILIIHSLALAQDRVQDPEHEVQNKDFQALDEFVRCNIFPPRQISNPKDAESNSKLMRYFYDSYFDDFIHLSPADQQKCVKLYERLLIKYKDSQLLDDELFRKSFTYANRDRYSFTRLVAELELLDNQKRLSP